MRKVLTLAVLFFCFISGRSGAETIVIDASHSIQMDLPGGKWQLTREAPPFLVDETVEHLTHELTAKNKNPSPEKVREAAKRRLAANEAYLCQSESQACLVVDFSPLRPGEEPPSAKSVGLSARYAAEGLEDEEGISGLKQSVRQVHFSGASSAYRIDASYLQHGEKRKFIGIVGFSHPHWFYLYYTDPMSAPADASAIEKVLTSASAVKRGNPK